MSASPRGLSGFVLWSRVGHLHHGGMGSKTQDKAEEDEVMGDEAFGKGTEGPAGLQDGMEGVVVAV